MWYERVPRWAWAVAAGVILLSLAAAIHGAGWNQGFMMGLLAGHTDGAQIAPYFAHRGGFGWHHGGFGLIGGLFRLLFFFLLIGLLLKFFGFWRWRRHGGPHGPWGQGPWAHHGPWGQGPWTQPGQSEQGSPTQPGQPGSATPDQPAENKPQPTSWTHV
jgi:hypothetical protein